MSRALFAVAIACAVAVAVAQPTFPDNWTSDQTNQIAINQGGVKNPDGSICCPPDAPECKVQTGFSAAIQYQWYSGNMSATKGPDNSGIVVDFNAQKEYAVLANGTCTAYCPLGGQTMSPGIGIGPNATNLGKVNYNGRMLNLYQVLTQIPILNITMEATNFYVDESGPTPVPVAIIQLIEPLGHQIGQQNNTFVTFVPGVPDKSHFTVVGAASCPMSKNCNGNNGGDDDGGQGSSMFMTARRLASEGTVEMPEANIVSHMGVGQKKIQLDW